MTEAEWNSCTDPQTMLAWLRDSGQTTDRKLRLYAVACCRWFWPAFKDKSRRRAVTVAERYADGQRSSKAEEALASLAEDSPLRWLLEPDAWTAVRENRGELAGDILNALVYPTRWLAEGSVDTEDEESAIYETASQRYVRAQADLVRDIFPRRVIRVQRAWLEWNNRMALALARDIYRQPNSQRMLVLADVLEAAGCTEARLLAHLRSPGVHARGCWVLDLLLDKAGGGPTDQHGVSRQR